MFVFVWVRVGGMGPFVWGGYDLTLATCEPERTVSTEHILVITIIHSIRFRLFALPFKAVLHKAVKPSFIRLHRAPRGAGAAPGVAADFSTVGRSQLSESCASSHAHGRVVA